MKFHRDRLPKPETMGIEAFTEIELETIRHFVSNLSQSPARMKQFIKLLEEEAIIVEKMKKEKQA